MDPTLQQLKDELAHSLQELTPAQILHSPQNDPARWKIHQIIEHLLLTYSSTVESILTRLEKGSPTRSSPTASQSLAQIVVLRLGLMPGRHQAPPLVTPSGATPGHSITGERLAVELSAGLHAMDTVLDRAQATFGLAPCVSHFALGPLSIPQWRRFHLVHGRHHLRQILIIRRGYPH